MEFFLLSFAANALFGQWIVLDGSKLPEAGDPVTWFKFRTNIGITDGTTSVLTSIQEDPDIDGNFFLRNEDLAESVREAWEHNLNNKNPVGATIICRAKPIPL